MTEEEAKKKWCPMVRFNGGRNESTFNRGDDDVMNRPDKSPICIPNCIASDCMMWRTSRGDNDGYCGLAGKL